LVRARSYLKGEQYARGRVGGATTDLGKRGKSDRNPTGALEVKVQKRQIIWKTASRRRVLFGEKKKTKTYYGIDGQSPLVTADAMGWA